MKPRKPIRRVSNARGKQLREYANVKAEFFKYNCLCESCGSRLLLQDRELHHCYGRAGRLLCWQSGFVLLCHSCHQLVHWFPQLAIKNGLLGPMGTFNDYARALNHYESLTK